MKDEKLKIKAFTLVELLVVIAIISLLSSIVLASLGTAREKAKIARAQQELFSIRNAIVLLQNDTGVGPCGCPLNPTGSTGLNNPELELNDDNSGLISKPTVGGKCVSSTSCGWTQIAVDKWRSAYFDHPNLLDPWGRSYIIDFDFFPFLNRSTDKDGKGYNYINAQFSCPNAPPELQTVPNEAPAEGWAKWARPVVHSLGPTPYSQFSYESDCFSVPGPGPDNLGDCNTCREVWVPLY